MQALLEELLKTGHGRKIAFLLQHALREVPTAIPETMKAAIEREEEKVRQEGRQEIIEKAKMKGINLIQILRDEEAEKIQVATKN